MSSLQRQSTDGREGGPGGSADTMCSSIGHEDTPGGTAEEGAAAAAAAAAARAAAGACVTATAAVPYGLDSTVSDVSSSASSRSSSGGGWGSSLGSSIPRSRNACVPVLHFNSPANPPPAYSLRGRPAAATTSSSSSSSVTSFAPSVPGTQSPAASPRTTAEAEVIVNSPMSQAHNAAAAAASLSGVQVSIVRRAKRECPEPVVGSDSLEYVAYTLRVCPLAGGGGGGGSSTSPRGVGMTPWTVERRYTDFLELKRRLKQSCPIKARFPSRLLRNTPAALAEREYLLVRYLSIALTAVPQYPATRYSLGSFLACEWADAWRPLPLLPRTVHAGMQLVAAECQARGAVNIQQYIAHQHLRREGLRLRKRSSEVAIEASIASIPWIAACVVGRSVQITGAPVSYDIMATGENGSEWLTRRRYKDFLLVCTWESGVCVRVIEQTTPTNKTAPRTSPVLLPRARRGAVSPEEGPEVHGGRAGPAAAPSGRLCVRGGGCCPRFSAYAPDGFRLPLHPPCCLKW